MARFYVFSLLGYFLLLAIYIFYISPVWKEAGFDLYFSLFRVVLSAILLGGFAAMLPNQTENTRGFFIVLIFLIQLIPSLVLYSGGPFSGLNFLLIFSGILMVFVFSATRVPLEHTGVLTIEATQNLFILISVLTVVLVIFFVGLDNFNLNIANVYEYRDVALENAPVSFNYIVPIVTKFIIPFGVVISLRDKNYVSLIVFFACAVALFGLTSHKSIVFYVCLAAVLYALWGYWRKAWLVAALFGAALLVGLIDALILRPLGGGWPAGLYASFGIRRALLVPAMLNYLHLAFFWENAPGFWSNSRITLGLLDYPYDLPIPNLIGRAFYDSAETSANTGYLGSGFAQAGVIGLFVYSAGVGLVIAVLDALGRKIGHRVVVAAVSAQVVTMVLSADFVTMFLTHGLLISLLVLLAIRPDMRPEKAAIVGRAP
jgi:hypothetical protein